MGSNLNAIVIASATNGIHKYIPEFSPSQTDYMRDQDEVARIYFPGNTDLFVG